MEIEKEVALLTELQNCPLSLRVALYDICIASEIEDRGLSAVNMEDLQTALRHALEFSYDVVGKISLDTYDYIYRCFLK